MTPACALPRTAADNRTLMQTVRMVARMFFPLGSRESDCCRERRIRAKKGDSDLRYPQYVRSFCRGRPGLTGLTIVEGGRIFALSSQGWFPRYCYKFGGWS